MVLLVQYLVQDILQVVVEVLLIKVELQVQEVQVVEVQEITHLTTHLLQEFQVYQVELIQAVVVEVCHNKELAEQVVQV
tara:strand:+ start:345 stop:581 length:237 start_codon:yes stop_codon:yes gene_type:complete